MNLQLTLSVLPDGSVLPEWTTLDGNLPETAVNIQNKLFELYENDREKWLFYLGFHSPDTNLSASINYFIRFSKLFVEKLSRETALESLRHNVNVNISDVEIDNFIYSIPIMTGAEYMNRDYLVDLWASLLKVFSFLIKNHDGTVESFFAAFNPDIHLVGQVFFHLVESKHPEWPFAFTATYTTGMGADGKPMHRLLKNAVDEFDDVQYLQLLSKVHRTAEKSALINELIQTGDLFCAVHWTSEEAFLFLREIPLYESTGVLCRIPDWWKKRSSGAKLKINMGDRKPSLAGLDAILDFHPEILLGDIELSEEEAIQILHESEGLAFIKNRWVAVDHDKLKQIIEAYDAIKNFEQDGLTIREAMQFQLNPDKVLDLNIDISEISVSNGEWLNSVIEKMKSPHKISNIQPAKGFRATLREYQQKGLNWLKFMDSLGFGACLADDMGLGKTIQVLAFLSILKQERNNFKQNNGNLEKESSKLRTYKTPKANLLIVPASLMSNWLNEITSFFPELNSFLAHPDYIKDNQMEKEPDELDKYDLVITTYGLSKKYEWLKNYHWNYIILDEAQAIKNPATKQTIAVKKLNARNRIIMSGTPVENRISDLWSLIDFLNPGLLGNKTEFRKFSKELKDNPDGYSRLRRLVSPYILRRLKTDKSVISDLPEKIEMKVYSGLTNKQVLLYEKALIELKEFLENSEGIQRKGVVLSSLMKFKQLCNHPDQFTGTGEYRENDSGKFSRLREICETIYEKRERVLVFTQFKEMTEPLRHFLKTIFKRDGLVLHGSIPVGKRKQLIEEFQDEIYCPFMVLSLKAGGVGLNLTRANHVIHFDRWWNPAVENQATDRAFRIGQKKNVIVHKFITQGTIEEKIDKMIEDKKSLADKVVSDFNETLITEMDNKEILNLFQLSL